ICAVDDTGCFIASDIPAVLKRTNRYYTLEEGEIAVINKDRVRVYDADHRLIRKELKTADWDVEAAEKGNYPHFMLKEIFEQPEVIRKTVSPRVVNGLPELGVEGLTDAFLKDVRRIVIVACGTAMHAGMVGKTVIERLARVPVQVEIASEFRYNDPILEEKDLVLVISQSGETADSLAALRLAKEKGCKTMAVVNVVGSSIAREADFVFYTWAGPEIAVASTKAYTVQISSMYLLALRLCLIHKSLTEDEVRALTDELMNKMPVLVQETVNRSEEIKRIAEDYKDREDLFFIGRGIDYSLSMEGSLKLKEISYVHSEAYAAGELKHGTISLITKGMPVIAVATWEACYEKMLSNIKEVRARGASVILICKKGAVDADRVSDHIVDFPDCSEMFMPMLAVPAMQLFAYHMAVARGCDVDRPRNLAKSVTVE
ncbi:MAG: glutamine--fructose-6-phosphate transaminase (isomerizing), partial [Clostridia bacterium]|nr:glutamine--fructose-6-phosphate transaminase (isomerizing) [Clostridia bacterium]